MSDDPFLDALNARVGQGPARLSAKNAMSSDGGDLGGVAARIAAVEGTGRNQRSTAQGVGQFTNGTWLGTYRRHYGDDGLTDQQILAKRDDPQFARSMLGLLVQDNAQALQSSGHDATPGNVYLANHFGPAGAHAILSADPSTPIERVVSPQVIAANPQLAGKTTGDIAAWTAQRMQQEQPPARDPFREALADDAQAPASQANEDPNDPYLAALNDVIRSNASLPRNALAPALMGSGGDRGSNGRDYDLGGGNSGSKGQAASTGRFLASFDPAFDSIVNGSNYLHNVQDRVAGLVHGATALPETMMEAAAWVTDKTGSPKSADTLRRWAGNLDAGTANLAHNPNSNNFAVGKFGGEVAALAPVAEVTPLTAGARAIKAGKLATGLARYGDMAMQGAAGGALISKGENVGEKAAAGALLAPVLGATVDVAAPIAMQIAEKAASTRIAKAVSERLAAMDRGAATVEEAGAPAASQSIRKGSDLAGEGWTPDEIAQGWRKGANGTAEWYNKPQPGDRPVGETNIDPATGKPKITVNIYGDETKAAKAAGAKGAATAAATDEVSPEVSAYVDAYLAGHGRGSSAADLEMQQFAANHGPEIEQEFARRATASNSARAGEEVPPSGQKAEPNSEAIPAEDVAQALGSSGARSGIEATTHLPTEVANSYRQLRSQGVPPDQALREADIRFVGGKPTIAAVTRNPEDQAATWEGAKHPTPEGRALSAQIAQNNAAVLGKAQSMVEANGGVPYQGEAAETAATSLAKASDAERQRVSAAYTAAREAEGNQTVSIDSLRELLAKPEYRAPTDAASRELIGGMKKLVKEMGATSGNRFTPDQIESLRQAANAAYDRMGGSVNNKVGEIKAALDDSLDQLDNAGPAYREARSAHKAWASKYENPNGISGLIQRDAQGNFINGDNWRAAEGFISSMSDKQFVQVARQLKANGDAHTLARLKASILQRAYEKATSNAMDRLGNATMSGKRFFDALNGIGTAKLHAVFTSHELAQIASIGRAARALNEAVPGTANTSNTASALAKALMAQKPSGKTRAAMRIGGHIAGLATGHLGGNAAVEGAHFAAKAVGERSRASKLAEALREAMDPRTARAAERARAQRMADALRRRAAARAAAQKTSPVTGAIAGRKER